MALLWLSLPGMQPSSSIRFVLLIQSAATFCAIPMQISTAPMCESAASRLYSKAHTLLSAYVGHEDFWDLELVL